MRAQPSESTANRRRRVSPFQTPFQTPATFCGITVTVSVRSQIGSELTEENRAKAPRMLVFALPQSLLDSIANLVEWSVTLGLQQ